MSTSWAVSSASSRCPQTRMPKDRTVRWSSLRARSTPGGSPFRSNTIASSSSERMLSNLRQRPNAGGRDCSAKTKSRIYALPLGNQRSRSGVSVSSEDDPCATLTCFVSVEKSMSVHERGLRSGASRSHLLCLQCYLPLLIRSDHDESRFAMILRFSSAEAVALAHSARQGDNAAVFPFPVEVQ